MNAEGYPDPTADKAIKRADRAPERVAEVIRLMKAVAALAGYETINRIHLKDQKTGKEYK